jgi:Ni/Co efflux regulator RcnB
MKAYPMETVKKAVLIVLLSVVAPTAGPLRAAQTAARAADKGRTPATQAEDKDQDAAQQKQDDEKEREREREEREQEKQEHERDRTDRLYEKGTRALDKRQWEDAVKLFDEMIKKGGDRAEGAYYWKAYAENKQGKRENALLILGELKKAYPQSRWLNDAKELEVEVRQAGGQPVDPAGQTEEELKLMALSGVMHADPEKALPLLQKLLESSQPRKIKEQALFVLSQSGSEKAREIVAGFARGKTNPDLQLKSLEYLALFGGKESRKTLEEVYASTDDRKIKRSILGFFMIGGDRDRLLAAAKGEKDGGLRGEAIGQLGVLGARDELFQMYQAESEVKLKKRILDALFVGGAADKMIDLAQNEKDPELRRAAIEKLGLMGSERTAGTLVKLYDNETDKGIRKKVIEALFLQGNARALVAIARKETDPELKKKAVEQLSIMNSKEATEFFEELLSK